MRTRTEVLNDLLERRRPLPELSDDLSRFSWNSDEALVRLSKANVASVLQEYLRGEVSIEDIAGWASLIECRDDIDYEELADIVFQLATPEIHDTFNETVAAKIIDDMGV